MYRLRAALERDREDLQDLLKDVHLSFSSLHSPSLQKQMIDRSLKSFSMMDENPSAFHAEGVYFFVLEEMHTKEILGCSALYAKNSHSHSFHLLQESLFLSPCSIESSEIAALYLSKKQRGQGLAKLLSLGRFLFAASFPSCFQNIFCAHLRGERREDASVPFWEECMRPLLHMEMKEAMHFFSFDAQKIAHALPHEAIAIATFSQEMQKSLGKVQSGSLAAQHMLEKEGFCPSGELDLLDAGPSLSCERKRIASISQSHSKACFFRDRIRGEAHLISNEKIDFAASILPIEIDEKHVFIHPKHGSLLGIKEGDSIRYRELS